jgi:Flp pilus assembly protein TadG
MIRRFIDLTRERTGTAAIEFALVAPLLFLLFFGIVQFGIVLNNYMMLTTATQSAARQFALSRGAGSSTLCTAAKSQVSASASSLTLASLTVTCSVGNLITGVSTVCADASCQGALDLGQGAPATVTATYPCDLMVYGHNYSSGICTLTAQTTERIE